jgi:hypothetical protein
MPGFRHLGSGDILVVTDSCGSFLGTQDKKVQKGDDLD